MTLLGKMTGVASDLASKAGDLKDIGVEKIKATVEELNTTLPHVREVGYSVTRICLEMALAPKIVVSLTKVFDVEDSRFAAVLKELAQHKVFCTVLSALRQVNNLQAKIQFQGRCLRDVDIELGLPPSVRMVFAEVERSDSRSAAASSGRAPIAEELTAPVSPPEAVPATIAMQPPPPPQKAAPVSPLKSPDSGETEAWPATEIPTLQPEYQPTFEHPAAPAEQEPALEPSPAALGNEPTRDFPATLVLSPALPKVAPEREPSPPAPSPEQERTLPVEEAPFLPELELPELPRRPRAERASASRARANPPAKVGSMIHFRCLGCNHRVRAAAKAVGRLSRCKKCGTVLKIPDASK